MEITYELKSSSNPANIELCIVVRKFDNIGLFNRLQNVGIRITNSRNLIIGIGVLRFKFSFYYFLYKNSILSNRFTINFLIGQIQLATTSHQ